MTGEVRLTFPNLSGASEGSGFRGGGGFGRAAYGRAEARRSSPVGRLRLSSKAAPVACHHGAIRAECSSRVRPAASSRSGRARRKHRRGAICAAAEPRTSRPSRLRPTGCRGASSRPQLQDWATHPAETPQPRAEEAWLGSRPARFPRRLARRRTPAAPGAAGAGGPLDRPQPPACLGHSLAASSIARACQQEHVLAGEPRQAAAHAHGDRLRERSLCCPAPTTCRRPRRGAA